MGKRGVKETGNRREATEGGIDERKRHDSKRKRTCIDESLTIYGYFRSAY